jgi:hypothetical protein
MENEKDKPEADSAQTTAAKTVGKVAAKTAVVASPSRPKSSTARKRSEARLRRPKLRRLAKKNKARIPRKLKKARKKLGEVQA